MNIPNTTTPLTEEQIDLIRNVNNQIAYHDDGGGVYEGLASEIFSQLEDDDESYENIGREIWSAYQKAPDVVDQVLIGLCGWSMKSLLSFANIISD